jgi:hypothetical protein
MALSDVVVAHQLQALRDQAAACQPGRAITPYGRRQRPETWPVYRTFPHLILQIPPHALTISGVFSAVMRREIGFLPQHLSMK